MMIKEGIKESSGGLLLNLNFSKHMCNSLNFDSPPMEYIMPLKALLILSIKNTLKTYILVTFSCQLDRA